MVQKQAQVAVGSEGTKKPVLIGIGVVVLLIVVVGGFFFFSKGKTAGQAINVGSVQSGKDIDYYVSKGFYGGTDTVVTNDLKATEGVDLKVWGYVPVGKSAINAKVKVTFDTSKVTYIAGGTLLDQGIDAWDTNLLFVDKGSSGDTKIWTSIYHVNLDATKALPEKRGYELAEFRFKVKDGITLTPLQLAEAIHIDTVELYDLDSSQLITAGNLILQLNGETTCQKCPPQIPPTIDTFDVASVDAMALGAKVTVDQMKIMCTQDKFKGVCTVNSGGQVSANADLNGDTKINDGDIIIIQLAMLAAESGYSACGDATKDQGACDFSTKDAKLFICENLKNSYTASFSCKGGKQNDKSQ